MLEAYGKTLDIYVRMKKFMSDKMWYSYIVNADNGDTNYDGFVNRINSVNTNIEGSYDLEEIVEALNILNQEGLISFTHIDNTDKHISNIQEPDLYNLIIKF